MAGVFISYRQGDSKAWAVLLRDDLVEVFGPERIFLDRDALQAGSWRSQIDQALAACSVTLLVIGRGWSSAADERGRRLDQPDDVHRQEIARALARPGMTLIPVLVDDARLPTPAELPEDIRALTECQARRLSDTAAHREVDVRALAHDIERLGGLARLAAPTPAAPGPAPTPAPAPAPAAEPAFRYLPFSCDEAAAAAAFKAWAEGLLMAPKGFAAQARLQPLAASWVPHWRVRASVNAVWQGRRGERRRAVQAVAGAAPQARNTTHTADDTEWTPVQGELKALITDLVLPAAALDDDSPTLLGARQLSQVLAAEALPDVAVPIRPTSVARGPAQALAAEEIQALMTERARKQIGGDRQEVIQLDQRIEALTLEPVLAPAWVGSYGHGDKTYALWISGATGEVGAARPLGAGKVTLLVLLSLAVVAAVVGFFWLR